LFGTPYILDFGIFGLSCFFLVAIFSVGTSELEKIS
jgi:hypothetical protein